MKKSKSSKEKRKRSPGEKSKKKHSKTSPKTVEKERKKDNEEKLPRKTRWEMSNTKDEPDKQTPTSRNDETSYPEPQRHLKDMLQDRKKIVEYLFLTVTATALQELIPDYLKNRSIDELQKMCYAEIKDMSDEHILDIAKGKGSSNSLEAKSVELKSAETKEGKEFPTFESFSPGGGSESLSSDLLELCASSSEMKDLNIDNEEEVSVLEDQEIGELKVNESDADLIELEMRARAIRSLLKAKDKAEFDLEE